MQSKQLAGNKPTASTQSRLDIAEIRDDVVVLKDGTLRGVLTVASINFSLKSDEEQEAIIYAYMNFLNTLEYPIQIVIQSRRLNIDDYVARLAKSSAGQTNELLRTQTDDYISFVKELVSLGQIMTKTFYVTVPYSPFSDKKKGFLPRMLEVLQPGSVIRLKESKFQEYRNELLQRVGHIQTGLSSMGLNSVLLNTQQLIELYYRVYNPDIYDVEKLPEITKIQTEEDSMR